MIDSPAINSAEPTSARAGVGSDVAVLVALIALTIWLRVHFADADPSYDELWHLALSAGRGTPLGQFAHDVVYQRPWSQTSAVGAPGFWNVWRGMDGVLHPPLYVLTLRLWRDAFGDSDAIARGYTIAWSAVGVVFEFLAARLVMGRALAALAAIAFACAPTQVYFGQEIRGYAMLAAIGSIAIWMMTRIEVGGPTRGRAIALALVPPALLLTHYFGVGGAIAIAIFGLWRLPTQRRAFLATLTLGGVFYAIAWLPFALRQLKDIGTGDEFLRVPRLDPVAEFLFVASAPIRLLVDRSPYTDRSNLVGALLLVMPWLLVRRLPALRPWAIWLCCAILTIAALDVTRTTRMAELIRYFAVASPAVVLLIVGCVRAVKPSLAYLAAAGVAFMGAIYTASNTGVLIECSSFSPPVRDMAKAIAPGDGIVIYHGRLPTYASDLIALTCSHQSGLFPRPVVVLSGEMTPAIRAALPRRVWLFTGELTGSVEALMPGGRVISSRGVDIATMLYQIEFAATPAAGAATSSTSAPAE